MSAEELAPSAERAQRPSPLARVGIGLLGVVIAAFGAVCGIGGGLFAGPILHYGFKLPLKRSTASALALVSATAISATLSEALRADSSLPWLVIGIVIPAALIGAQLGFGLSTRISTRALKGLFCLALCVVGARLLLGAQAAPAVGGFVPGALDLLAAAAVGLFAGVAVPLLGVGGGLVLVPGLLLLVPELGFVGARPTSLAVACITAPRSLWLHHRRGGVDWSLAQPLALGALIGAAVGVSLVHFPSVAVLGQALLGATLWFSAVRFGVDFWRSKPS